jgi:hypothetical protein
MIPVSLAVREVCRPSAGVFLLGAVDRAGTAAGS